jgi:hypothetical protein
MSRESEGAVPPYENPQLENPRPLPPSAPPSATAPGTGRPSFEPPPRIEPPPPGRPVPAPPVGRRPIGPRDKARLMLGLSVGVTLLLYWIPYGYVFVYPLLLLSTLAHEMGHGLMAEVVGGDFDRFLMWSDGSGLALYMSSPSRIGQALVAAGGLIGPAVAAALLFRLARTAIHARRIFYGIGAVLLILMVFYVRNLFGFFFVAGLVLLSLVLGRAASDELAQLLLVFVAVQLALSVFSRADYLFTAVAETGGGVHPSDVAQIAQALWLPYWFWGAACGAFSLLVLWHGFKSFWR